MVFLIYNFYIYVIVIVKNFVGLQGVFYSDKIFVDLILLNIEEVLDGDFLGDLFIIYFILLDLCVVQLCI